MAQVAYAVLFYLTFTREGFLKELWEKRPQCATNATPGAT
jgi:hypothetical protein